MQITIARHRKFSLVCVAACLTAGCATFPRTPAHPSDDPRFSPDVRVEKVGVPNDPVPTLALLPGDQVAVETISSTTSTVSVTIDSGGNLHVPLAGDVSVGALTLGDAERRVKVAMQRYDKFVHVNLRLLAPTGHNATVLGAVAAPGVIPVAAGARLSDVLLRAGGELISQVNGQMVSGSDMQRATLVRAGRALPVDFRKALAGNLLHNVFIHAGDHINVPPQQGNNVIVLGAAGGAVFQWAPGMRLTEALARAGGVPPAGDKSDIRVIRGPLEAPRVYQSSLREIVDGESHDVELYAGDILWVEEHWIEDFGEIMQVLGPVIGIGFSVSTLAVALAR